MAVYTVTLILEAEYSENVGAFSAEAAKQELVKKHNDGFVGEGGYLNTHIKDVKVELLYE